MSNNNRTPLRTVDIYVDNRGVNGTGSPSQNAHGPTKQRSPRRSRGKATATSDRIESNQTFDQSVEGRISLLKRMLDTGLPENIAGWAGNDIFIKNQAAFAELFLPYFNKFPILDTDYADMFDLAEFRRFLQLCDFEVKMDSSGVLKFSHRKYHRNNGFLSILPTSSEIRLNRSFSTELSIPAWRQLPPSLSSFTNSNQTIGRNNSNVSNIRFYLQMPYTPLDIIFIMDAGWVATNMATQVPNENRTVSVFNVAALAIADFVNDLPAGSLTRIAAHAVTGREVLDSTGSLNEFTPISTDTERKAVVQQFKRIGELQIRTNTRKTPFNLELAMETAKKTLQSAENRAIIIVLVSEKAPNTAPPSAIPHAPVYTFQLPGEASIKENNLDGIPLGDPEAALKICNHTKGMFIDLPMLDRPNTLAEKAANSMSVITNHIRNTAFAFSALSIRAINGGEINCIASKLGIFRIASGAKESTGGFTFINQSGDMEEISKTLDINQNTLLWENKQILPQCPTPKVIADADAMTVVGSRKPYQIAMSVDVKVPVHQRNTSLTGISGDSSIIPYLKVNFTGKLNSNNETNESMEVDGKGEMNIKKKSWICGRVFRNLE
ncbi:hypothetical protein HK098_004380 [Nowakowskiella sp. JEL0407]|nr:hypothetical protein HK098_004380 [Nowakowskiella sp. JEL0407]